MAALTLRKSEWLEDWYVIELAEHDGRQYLEPVAAGVLALRCSSRMSDADVEGTASEMKALADAIERRDRVSFRRCAVDARGERVLFRSPRNSTVDGECDLVEADALAAEIRAKLLVGDGNASDPR